MAAKEHWASAVESLEDKKALQRRLTRIAAEECRAK
jgi:hypothetical protein